MLTSRGAQCTVSQQLPHSTHSIHWKFDWNGFAGTDDRKNMAMAMAAVAMHGSDYATRCSQRIHVGGLANKLKWIRERVRETMELKLTSPLTHLSAEAEVYATGGGLACCQQTERSQKPRDTTPSVIAAFEQPMLIHRSPRFRRCVFELCGVLVTFTPFC